MSKGGAKWDFRDVGLGLKILRDFLLGRTHTLHGRFPPLIAPRTLPTPDVPRGPETKYSAHYYCNRHVKDSVKPPVVAPGAQSGMRPDSVCFHCAPTPGSPWWWDGHCYYECVPDPATPAPPCPEEPPPCPPPCPPCSPPCPPCPPPPCP